MAFSEPDFIHRPSNVTDKAHPLLFSQLILCPTLLLPNVDDEFVRVRVRGGVGLGKTGEEVRRQSLDHYRNLWIGEEVE